MLLAGSCSQPAPAFNRAVGVRTADFAYLGAGTQDWISGWLLDSHKTVVEGKTIYDFTPAFYFWIGASVLSVVLAACAWNVKPRE